MNTKKSTESFFSVNKASVIIDSVKKAEDSKDIIVRLYESHGGRTHFRLHSALPVKSANLCNMMEVDGNIPIK